MSSPGQAVLAVVGAVVGFYVGGPTGAFYGFSVGMALGGALFPPDIDTPRPTPNQLQIQTSMYGGAVPVVFGSRRVSGNLLWCGELQTQENEVSGGGKGGGGSSSIAYSYTISMAWGLCMARDPRKHVIRAWAGKDEITDGSFADCATVYDGSQTDPDPTIAADARAVRHPVWKNFCYVVLKDFPLGNSPVIPNFTFEVTDLEEWCFQKAGKLVTPTNAFHRVLYTGGNLYVLNDVPSGIRLSKINPETMAEEAYRSFSGEDWYLLSAGGLAGALIDLPGLNRIALCLGRVGSSWYIFELSKDDLSVLDKIPVGDVCRGSDNNLYVCRAWYGDDPAFAPVTGQYWTSEWHLLDPDSTIYDTPRAYGGGNNFVGGGGEDCCPIYDDGFYYIPIWAAQLIKKNRSTGVNLLSTGGPYHYLAHGEEGFLYAAYGPGISMHIRKVSKATLDAVAIFTDPVMLFIIHQLVYENGYLYVGARGTDEVHRAIKMSAETGEILATYSVPSGEGGISDLVIVGNNLIV